MKGRSKKGGGGMITKEELKGEERKRKGEGDSYEKQKNDEKGRR